jgi:syntaxin 8
MSQLNKKLGKIRSLTDQERERRVRQLEVLASKKVQLDSRFQNTPGSSARTQLFEASSRNPRLFDDDEDEAILANNAPIETIQAEKEQILVEQDRGLDNLAKAISRQKHIAIRIGSEIEDQNTIIDDIANQMDHTANRVNRETRHVDEVTSKDSTWSLWLIILSLFVAIIVVGIL